MKIILTIALSKKLNRDKLFNASDIVREASTHINGKGGGQSFFAMASGNKLDGVNSMLKTLHSITQKF